MYTRRKFEELKFEFVKDIQLYKTLISYSGWNLFGNIAAVAKGQGVNILLNIFFGPVINAARGIAIQVQAAVNSFVSNFQMAVNPQIIKSYAADEKDYMLSLVIRSSKFSFYLLYLLSLPIIIEIDQILKLWLVTVPNYASIFTILVLIIILIDCVSGPLMTSVQATGKIKLYQTVVGSLQFLILPISYFFLKNGYTPETTLYINIIISIIALIFRILFLKRIINFPVLLFMKEVVLKNILIVIISFFPLLFLRTMMETNALRIITIIVLSILWSGVLIYYFGLNKTEKKYIYFSIKNLRLRIFKK